MQDAALIVDRLPQQGQITAALLAKENIFSLCAQTFIEALQANKIATHEGEVIESDIPDHHMRMEAATRIAKICGELTDSQSIHIDARSVHNYAGNNPETSRAMLAIMQEMKEIRAQIKQDKATMLSEPLATNTLETPVAQGLAHNVQSSTNKSENKK